MPLYAGTKSAVGGMRVWLGVTYAEEWPTFMEFTDEINLLEITNQVNGIPNYIYQPMV